MATNADADRPAAGLAPFVDRLDRHAEVLGELGDRHERVEPAQRIGLVSVFIPTRWEAVTGTFGVVRKRYERVGRRSDLRSVDQLKVEGLRWRDQFSNAFRPGFALNPGLNFVAGAGFEPATSGL